jgi:uncharacterized protein YozE (UPF0346 family)
MGDQLDNQSPTEMSFYSWMKAQTKRDDSIGDIARDVTEDECFPRRTGELAALRNHVEFEHTPDENALDALDRAHRKWRAQSVSTSPL